MLVGYMRISTADERHLHEDRVSGARDDRPGLKTCLAELKSSQSQTV